MITELKEIIFDVYNSVTSGFDVNIQDQTTRPLDIFFTKDTGATDFLSVAASFDDTSITLVDDTDFNVGDYIGIFAAGDKFYFGTILTLPGGNVLTLDTPIDSPFPIGSFIAATSREMNVDGSISAQTFVIRGAGVGSTLKLDITRLIFQIITTDSPTFEEFGDIADGLDNGCVLRRNNGEVENIFNVKTNGELSNLMYDLTFMDASNPSGVNGIAGRMTFAGQTKHGVALRLETGDTIDFIIQDDLSGLLTFRIIAQGHVVEN